jgi:hypothetical protein
VVEVAVVLDPLVLVAQVEAEQVTILVVVQELLEQQTQVVVVVEHRM